MLVALAVVLIAALLIPSLAQFLRVVVSLVILGIVLGTLAWVVRGMP